jgi:hypothetical protein
MAFSTSRPEHLECIPTILMPSNAIRVIHVTAACIADLVKNTGLFCIMWVRSFDFGASVDAT